MLKIDPLCMATALAILNLGAVDASGWDAEAPRQCQCAQLPFGYAGTGFSWVNVPLEWHPGECDILCNAQVTPCDVGGFIYYNNTGALPVVVKATYPDGDAVVFVVPAGKTGSLGIYCDLECGSSIEFTVGGGANPTDYYWLYCLPCE